MSRIDWTTVRVAATGGLILIVPGAFIADQLLDRDANRAWVWLFFALILVGFAVSGFIAGRLRDDTPMLHGAIGALIAFVVAQLFGFVVALANGGSVSWAATVLTALVAISMGVAGSLVSERANRRAMKTPPKARAT